MASDYYFGHGEAWLATRTTGGLPSDFDISLPEINSLTLSLGREKVEHVSKRTSVAGKDLVLTRLVSLTGVMNISTHTKEMLELYLYGDIVAVAGGAFAATAFEDTSIVVGQTVRIPGGKKNLSSLVLTDSTGSPVTLTLNTHYEIVDIDAGLVRFLDVTTGSVVQPFKAAGSEGAGSNVGILKQRQFEKWMLFKGINIADDDKVCTVDLYKVQFEPAANWTLLNDGGEVNAYELNFEALIDTTLDDSNALGRHGHYKELA
jgi:hypothetical protein